MGVGVAPLVGRVPELERLEAALEELSSGEAVWLSVVGDPGIGKTRLLRELRDAAEGRGYLVLSGAAAEFERDLPFSAGSTPSTPSWPLGT